MNQTDVAASNAIANSTPNSGSLELALREFLAFKLGDEEYGIDILSVQEIRSFERPTRMASASPIQLRPVPDFSSAIASDHVMAIGSLENRMLILLDIEKLMSCADMGLISATVQ
jgi:chemotaxis signal transduction protein